MKKELLKKADTVFARFIRMRDEGICPLCHCREVEVCGHIFFRAKYGTRLDPMNAWGICSQCNGEMEADHDVWLQFKDWFIRTNSQTEWDSLEHRSNRSDPLTIKELEEAIERFTI